MKRLAFVLLLLLLLPKQTFAAELPKELLDAADGNTREVTEEMPTDAAGLTKGILTLFQRICPELGQKFRGTVRSAVLLLLIVLLAGLAEGSFKGAAGEGRFSSVSLAAILAMTGLMLKDLGGFAGESLALLRELGAFSEILLPCLAAAVAATGAVASASVQQVTTVWFSSMIIRFLSEVLMPLLYCYVALAAASAALGDGRLNNLAEGLKKMTSWILTAVVSIFTAYLSVAHVLSGSSDALTLRAAKAALSGTVPVVGGIISDAAETVLAGAGMLRNAIGIFGMLGVISICLLPFLSLLVQYLIFQLAAIASSSADGGMLSSFLASLTGAFGLLLGMIGSAALLVLISVFSSIAVVIP